MTKRRWLSSAKRYDSGRSTYTPTWSWGGRCAGSDDIQRPSEVLERAARAAPESARVQKFLGVVRYEQHRIREAEGALLRAVDLDPTDADARAWLGRVFASEHRFDEARRQFEAALAVRPGHQEARNGLAKLDVGR